MPETRSAEDLTAALVTLEEKFADLESTVLPRLARRPTGDIEPTVRTTPKIDTLILNGQLVSRTTFAVLWQWVQDQGLITANLFTVGDGSTTFGLPDFRGRVPIGTGTLGADTYAHGTFSGAATRVIAIANMPNHDHNVSATSSGAGGHSHSFTTNSDGGHSHTVSITGAGSHSHSFSTSNTGGHGGHATSSANRGTAAPSAGTVATATTTSGAHSHTGTSDTEANHTHSGSATTASAHDHNGTTASQADHSHTINVSEEAIGGGSAFDVRQPSIALNWLIYV